MTDKAVTTIAGWATLARAKSLSIFVDEADLRDPRRESARTLTMVAVDLKLVKTEHWVEDEEEIYE